MKDNKLNVRDLINAGLFAILIFIATFIGGMIGFVPTLMPVVPFLQGIISGPVYMLYSTKIKKNGMVFIQTTVMSLVFFAIGHGPWVVLTGVLAGILAEVVLKKGNYNSIRQARLTFVIQSLWGLGNWLPIYLARDSYIKTMIDMGYGEEFAKKMMSVLPNWSLIPIILLGMVGTYIGCSIGIKILKKHFVRAGMAEV